MVSDGGEAGRGPPLGTQTVADGRERPHLRVPDGDARVNHVHVHARAGQGAVIVAAVAGEVSLTTQQPQSNRTP
jgi:hypothetical protein